MYYNAPEGCRHGTHTQLYVIRPIKRSAIFNYGRHHPVVAACWTRAWGARRVTIRGRGGGGGQPLHRRVPHFVLTVPLGARLGECRRSGLSLSRHARKKDTGGWGRPEGVRRYEPLLPVLATPGAVDKRLGSLRAPKSIHLGQSEIGSRFICSQAPHASVSVVNPRRDGWVAIIFRRQGRSFSDQGGPLASR